MFSHGCEGFEGIDAHGQASPIEMPSILVREGGQIGPSPSISVFQRVGRTTIGTDAA
jgi:hypothetical protein